MNAITANATSANSPVPPATVSAGQSGHLLDVRMNDSFRAVNQLLTAGAKIRMTFDNKDVGTQHTFHLFDGSDATAPSLFASPVVTGPATATFNFTAPSKPGSYFFHCVVHPGPVTATLTVK